MTTGPDIWNTLNQLTQTHRQLGNTLTELRAQLASLELPDKTTIWACPQCGIVRPTEQAVRDHLANVHGEPA